MRLERVCSAILSGLIWFSFAVVSFAQTSQITGRVTDSSNAVVPSAEVLVTNTDTGVTRTTSANELGYYTAPLLPRGNYRVLVRNPGFKTIERSGLLLDEGQVLRLDFALEVGQVTESVNVVGSASLIETATTTVSSVIPNQKILDMPMQGRNFFKLVDLVPGVRPVGGYSQFPVDSFGASSASISGGAPSSNNYMIDGAAADTVNSGTFTIFLSVDSIEEFRIITRNASAEYGRTGGGVVNVISKSGTNEFHGSAYEFLRNRALGANAWFSNRVGRDTRTPLKFNQYGATLGGPLARDKTFFFFNWEQAKRRTEARDFRTLPTLLQRRGDFSETRNAQGELIRIYNPLTTGLDPSRPGARIRDPFPGNVIPPDRIHAVARTVTGFYPEPNLPGLPFTEANNFLGQSPTPMNKNALGIKTDHHFTPSRRLSGRFTHDMTSLEHSNLFANIADPQTAEGAYPRRSAVFNYTDALRPDLLLEARAGWNRYGLLRNPRSFGFDPAQLGLPASLKNQMQYPLFPQFSPAGVSEIGSVQSNLIRLSSDAWTAAGAVTNVRGGHVIKFGAEQRLYRYNNSQFQPSLSFDFASTFTRGPDPNVASATAGYGFATFLLGAPTSGQARRWYPLTFQATNFGAFIQDDWKVSPKLTLNLGLRWEFEGAVTDRYNAISNFDPSVETRVDGLTLRGGLVFPGTAGLSRGMRDNAFTDFGPRVGFAWRFAPKTVFRGGFGLFYLPGTGHFVQLGRTGFELLTTMVTSVDGGFTPYNTLTDPFPEGIQLPPGSKLGPLTALGTSLTGNVRSMRLGYSEQWNANIQRDLPGGWLVELGYIGNHGIRLPANRTLAYLPSEFLSLGTQLQQLVPNPLAGLITVGPLSQRMVTRATLLRRHPQFTGVAGLDAWANSIYHGLTVRLEKRLSRGLAVVLAYTNSKMIDDNLGNGTNLGPTSVPTSFSGGGSNIVQNWDNLRAERAISTNDLPQRFVISASWDLPVGRSGHRVYRTLAGGWQLHSIVTLQSGNPISITAPAPALAGDRPNVVGDPNLSAPTIDRWFNTMAFEVIPPFTFGNGPRNLPSTRTDGLFNWDFSLMKNIAVTERVRLQFRGEFYNFTNTPTFGTPGTVLTAAPFGVINTTASSPRDVQLGLRLYF